MGQTEKLVFVSVPLTLTSLVVPTEPVKLTPYDLKKIQKHSKLNPHKLTSIFCQQGLSTTQKLKLRNLLIDPN